MEQMKWEQLLSGGSQVFFSLKPRQRDREAAQICASVETSAHAFRLLKENTRSPPSPTARARLPEDKELCFLLSRLFGGLQVSSQPLTCCCFENSVGSVREEL